MSAEQGQQAAQKPVYTVTIDGKTVLYSGHNRNWAEAVYTNKEFECMTYERELKLECDGKVLDQLEF